MSILSTISKAKSKFHEQKLKIRSRKLAGESNRLERKKNERIYQEGLAEMRKEAAREEKRILKAKSTNKREGFLSKIGKDNATLKGKPKLGKSNKAFTTGNKYALGTTAWTTTTGKGPNWSNVTGKPRVKGYNTSNLWGLGSKRKSKKR